MVSTIVSTETLFTHLDDPDWAIVDCSFDLARPDWGYGRYLENHIPGSLYAHLNKDLSGPITPQTGRHPLPDVDEIARRFGSWGIGPNTQVVAYDTVGGAFADRLWWLLRFLGHTSVVVLDGGISKWQQEGRPLKSGQETREPAQFIPHPHWQMIAGAEEVEQIRLDPAYLLIDARAAERYKGEFEPIDPVAGHIPGAVNRFHGLNLAQNGAFLPPEVLRAQFDALLKGRSPDHVVVYCGSGVTSIHHILAMELAGLPGARLYPGSWSEWIRDDNRQKSH